MGWESNNNNGGEDSLQLHGEARNKRSVGVIGRLGGGRFGHTAITAHDYFACRDK